LQRIPKQSYEGILLNCIEEGKGERERGRGKNNVDPSPPPPFTNQVWSSSKKSLGFHPPLFNRQICENRLKQEGGGAHESMGGGAHESMGGGAHESLEMFKWLNP
jgi:hypothetical protein